MRMKLLAAGGVGAMMLVDLLPVWLLRGELEGEFYLHPDMLAAIIVYVCLVLATWLYITRYLFLESTYLSRARKIWSCTWFMLGGHVVGLILSLFLRMLILGDRTFLAAVAAMYASLLLFVRYGWPLLMIGGGFYYLISRILMAMYEPQPDRYDV